MFSSPLQAYESGRRTSLSSRELEAAALFKAARLLEDCQQGWERAGALVRLDAALRHNQRLWTVFQSELQAPDHPLAPETRVNLLRLIGFVDRRTLEIRIEPSPDKLQALIELNRSIGAGLAAAADDLAQG
jgi:flagellar protein FlaF